MKPLKQPKAKRAKKLRLNTETGIYFYKYYFLCCQKITTTGNLAPGIWEAALDTKKLPGLQFIRIMFCLLPSFLPFLSFKRTLNVKRPRSEIGEWERKLGCTLRAAHLAAAAAADPSMSAINPPWPSSFVLLWPHLLQWSIAGCRS